MVKREWRRGEGVRCWLLEITPKISRELVRLVLLAGRLRWLQQSSTVPNTECLPSGDSPFTFPHSPSTVRPVTSISASPGCRRILDRFALPPLRSFALEADK